MQLSVSKWTKLPLLISVEEMEDLFDSITPFSLYQVQKVTLPEEGVIPISTFLKEYGHYIDCLKRGEPPPLLSAPVMSAIAEALFAIPTTEGRQLYKPRLPVIQIQGHSMRYSSTDQSFRSQLFGADTISWGLQFSFPQIYEDSLTHEILTTRSLPNGLLFHEIQKWIRRHTLPTPFIVEGRRQNVPFRLGKGCFSWINTHQGLQNQGISLSL